MRNRRFIERSLVTVACVVIILDLLTWWFEDTRKNQDYEYDEDDDATPNWALLTSDPSLLARDPEVNEEGVPVMVGPKGEKIPVQSIRQSDMKRKVSTIGPHEILGGFLFPETVANLSDGQIFFIDFNYLDPSPAPEIAKRKLCAVESAAKHHPKNQVQLVVSAKRFVLTPALRILVRSYPNIRIVRFHGDPFVGFGIHPESEFRDLHSAEVARYSLLHMHGGVYLDLDSIVVRPLAKFNDTIGHLVFNDQVVLSPHVMIFRPKHPFLDLVISETPRFYDPGDNYSLGYELVNGVYSSTKFNKSLIHLQPLHVFDFISKRDHAYPFDEDDGVKLKTKADKSKVYVVHYWGSLNNGTRIELASSQLLALLAWSHCPKVSRKSRGFM